MLRNTRESHERPAAPDVHHLARERGLEIEHVFLPTAHDIVAGGIRLHFLESAADVRAQPIVFLHGGGLNAHSWELLSLALASAYRCIAVDQRGHGDSEWSPIVDYSCAAYVTDIESFLSSLSLHQPVLVGHSLGGLNALAFASRHGHKLAGLVVLDASPDQRQSPRIRHFMRAHADFPSLDHVVEHALTLSPGRSAESLRASVSRNVRQLPNGRWVWKYDRRRFDIEDPEATEAERRALAAGLPAIPCPTLILRGAESDVVHDEDAARLASAIPDARWKRIDEAGHTIHHDNPSAVVAAIRSFLADLSV